MHKSILIVVGITILFLSMSITPSVAIDNVKKSSISKSDKNIIIVDDEGDGDYISIKEAVNYSMSGDIIEVYSGIYYEEKIVITTEDITLRGMPYELGAGNDFGKPVIKGITKSEPLISLKNSTITIDGFIMEGNLSYRSIVSFRIGDNNVLSNCDLIKGDGVYIYTNNNRIINNNFSGLNRGIHLCLWGINNSVIGNRIYNISLEGIIISYQHCNISGNILSDCDVGISIRFTGNVISNNIISNCNKGIEITEQFWNITIEYNELKQKKLGIETRDLRRDRMFYHNNFIKNDRDVIIHIDYWLPTIFTWCENYWDKWDRIGPKRIINIKLIAIFSLFLFIPVLKVAAYDLHPAKEPYDIGV